MSHFTITFKDNEDDLIDEPVADLIDEPVTDLIDEPYDKFYKIKPKKYLLDYNALNIMTNNTKSKYTKWSEIKICANSKCTDLSMKDEGGVHYYCEKHMQCGKDVLDGKGCLNTYC